MVLNEKWALMREALKEAKRTMAAADAMTTDSARMIIGRLRNVKSIYVLRNLKKELTEFNAHTGEWKT